MEGDTTVSFAVEDFEGGCLALGDCLYAFDELCPVLIGTASGSLLNLAPGSSENLQVLFAG